MSERSDLTYRIFGVLGLVLLLAVTLWSNSHMAHSHSDTAHDHSDPTQHGQNVEAKTIGDPSGFQVSGTVMNEHRVVEYDAMQYYFSPNPLVVYAGEKVELKVKSGDVEHGLVIPEIDFSAKMPLGDRVSVFFTAPEKPGEYPVFCSIYCGSGHGDMKGEMIVLPQPGKDGSKKGESKNMQGS